MPSSHPSLGLSVFFLSFCFGGKTKANGWLQELKVNILSGYDNVNVRDLFLNVRELVLTGLTRLLQIETDFKRRDSDFMNGRAIILHSYY